MKRLLSKIKNLPYEIRFCFGALVYACFGGNWRGSEEVLTDWESVRRILVVVWAAQAAMLAGLAFWQPTFPALFLALIALSVIVSVMLSWGIHLKIMAVFDAFIELITYALFNLKQKVFSKKS